MYKYLDAIHLSETQLTLKRKALFSASVQQIYLFYVSV